jgi:hypothetical protein
LRYAILDIVDALATNMRTDGSGALVSMLEKPLMKRRSLPGSKILPQSWWSDVAARDRLLYVRIALLFKLSQKRRRTGTSMEQVPTSAPVAEFGVSDT